MIEVPCQVPSNAPLWVFVVLAFLAHGRQTALLLKEVLEWALKRTNTRRGR
jgi:hypothetical protein